jgi:hypothetical protein
MTTRVEIDKEIKKLLDFVSIVVIVIVGMINMNERIQKLSEQADLYARSDNSSMLFENYQKRYTEKFAELIVRECSRVAKLEVGTNRVCDAIEKHFGVE